MNIPRVLSGAWIIFAVLLFSCAPEQDEAKKIPQHVKPVAGTGDLHFSTGQTVYVPAYSQIYSGSKAGRINLAVTLSIRNTDIDNPIIIKSVQYYDNDGTFLKEYVETALQLAPLASISLNIGQADKSGGIGANFIVKWGAQQTVYEPYIEAIMMGSHGSHGYAWRSPGYVIKEITN